MAIFGKGRVIGYNYDNCAAVEGERLRKQANLLSAIDKPLYRNVLNKYHEAVVLDIGCNEGDAALDRLQGLDVSQYIGIDISAVAIEKANKKYADDTTHFFRLDITSPSANRDLYSILKQCGVEKVDVVNISMMLLHLVEPEFVLEKVYPFLRAGGTIIVKDIDDRDNIAKPDNTKIFEESYAIAMANRDSGNRNIGREIPTWLKRYGYTNINCLMQGICSRGMTDDQKQTLWDIYYGFFMEDSVAECKYTNGSKQSIYNLGWCHYNFPIMHEIFMLPTFEFTLGICVYTATKEV